MESSQSSQPHSPCPACAQSDWELYTIGHDRMLDRPEIPWKVYRCRGCGLGRTHPMLTQQEVKPHYPPTYLGDTLKTVEEFLSGKLQGSRSWKNELDKAHFMERYVQKGRILDVGCADGKFLWALDASRWDRTGVDFSGETVRLVKQRLPDLNLLEGDIFSPQLEEGSFDVLTLWHVFEHLPRPQEALARARQLLRPGGWIFISLPNLASLQARIFQDCWYALDVPRHLHHYSPRPLELLLQKQGMLLQEHVFFSRTVNFHTLKYSLIYWSEGTFGGRLPYYLLKPLLLAFPWIEAWSKRYGTLTSIGRVVS